MEILGNPCNLKFKVDVIHEGRLCSQTQCTAYTCYWIADDKGAVGSMDTPNMVYIYVFFKVGCESWVLQLRMQRDEKQIAELSLFSKAIQNLSLAWNVSFHLVLAERHRTTSNDTWLHQIQITSHRRCWGSDCCGRHGQTQRKLWREGLCLFALECRPSHMLQRVQNSFQQAKTNCHLSHWGPTFINIHPRQQCWGPNTLLREYSNAKRYLRRSCFSIEVFWK